MDIQDLKTLVAVVEHGSITLAASELNRVPSGLTTRILQLEESLGVQLFLRQKKRLVVTPKGQILCNYANQVLRILEEAERCMRGTEPSGRFRIGTMDSTLASRLPSPLAKLHARHPSVDLELTTGTSRFLYELLLDNRLDAIFISDPPVDDRIEHTPVFKEELVLIAPEGHKPIHQPSDVGHTTVLAFKDGCSYRNRLIRWFQEYDAAPEKIADLTSYHAIMGGAAAGMGVGLVPASVVGLFLKKEALTIHRVAHPLWKAPTVLVWRSGMMSANIAALQECLPSQQAA